MFSRTLLRDLFIFSLGSLNIFIIAMLKSLSFVSDILYYSRPTLVGLLGSGGGILSCVVMIVFFAGVSRYLGLG